MSYCVTDCLDPIKLTQDLVRCPSVTPRDEGALDVLSQALQGCGFAVTRLPFQQEGTARVENIFARVGARGRHLCFLGHTDVVPVGREEDWAHPPFAAEIVDGKLYGRGVADMKGGVAAFAAAASAFLLQHPDFDESISLMITGDEEGVSVNGTVCLIDWAQKNRQMPDVAIVGEPSNPSQSGEVMRVGRRGSWNGKLTVHGKQGHSAYPERADNPIPKLMALLQHVVDAKPDEGNEFFPASHIVISSVDVGNTAPNIIPAHAEALFNARFNNHWTGESFDRYMRSLLDQAAIPYDLESWCNAESFMSQGEDWRDLCRDVIADITGRIPRYDTGGGTSDARFIAAHCPVVEYGGVNATIHQVNEHSFVAEIEELSRIYLGILEKYFYASEIEMSP